MHHTYTRLNSVSDRPSSSVTCSFNLIDCKMLFMTYLPSSKCPLLHLFLLTDNLCRLNLEVLVRQFTVFAKANSKKRRKSQSSSTAKFSSLPSTAVQLETVIRRILCLGNVAPITPDQMKEAVLLFDVLKRATSDFEKDHPQAGV